VSQTNPNFLVNCLNLHYGEISVSSVTRHALLAPALLMAKQINSMGIQFQLLC